MKLYTLFKRTRGTRKWEQASELLLSLKGARARFQTQLLNSAFGGTDYELSIRPVKQTPLDKLSAIPLAKCGELYRLCNMCDKTAVVDVSDPNGHFFYACHECFLNSIGSPVVCTARRIVSIETLKTLVS